MNFQSDYSGVKLHGTKEKREGYQEKLRKDTIDELIMVKRMKLIGRTTIKIHSKEECQDKCKELVDYAKENSPDNDPRFFDVMTNGSTLLTNILFAKGGENASKNFMDAFIESRAEELYREFLSPDYISQVELQRSVTNLYINCFTCEHISVINELVRNGVVAKLMSTFEAAKDLEVITNIIWAIKNALTDNNEVRDELAKEQFPAKLHHKLQELESDIRDSESLADSLIHNIQEFCCSYVKVKPHLGFSGVIFGNSVQCGTVDDDQLHQAGIFQPKYSL